MALREITVWPRHGLWRHGDFMRLWAAQAISAFGSRISRTALPIVALLVVGALPWEIGVLSALAVAPGILSPPPGRRPRPSGRGAADRRWQRPARRAAGH